MWEAKRGKFLRQPTRIAIEDVAKQKLRPNAENLNTRELLAISDGGHWLKIPGLMVSGLMVR